MESRSTPPKPEATHAPTFKAALSNRWQGPSPQEVARLLEPDVSEGLRALLCWRGAAGHDDTCWVSLGLAYLDLLQRESCGRCTPCRIGTHIMRDILLRLQDGTARTGDVEELQRLADAIEDTAWCGVANTVRDAFLGLLTLGAEHFARHAAGATCPPERTTGWLAAPCRSTCPGGVDCPSYIFQVSEHMPHLATAVVRQDNPLAGVIGRTCPHPCEGNCTLTQVDQPIAINSLKRWAADRAEGLGMDARDTGPYELSELTSAGPPEARPGARPPTPGPVRTHVAIVGAGPAGLSAAYYLARAGYAPVIFERLPVPGGMLYVGIPEYRLPKAVLRQEVTLIEREGVEIRYDTPVGKAVGFGQLLEDFPAVFLGIGAHAGRSLDIPGEDLPGSLDAIDFLRRVALGEEVSLGGRVLVIGGGNSAMDAARTCLRLGVPEVTVVYRRDRGEMPANPWEVDEAEEEGVRFHFLAAPVRCDGDACVTQLVCQPMELGPPDDSGRRRPVARSCDPIAMAADTVIAAVGQRPDFSPFRTAGELAFNNWGYLEMDPRTLMTSRAGVFVGGDAVSGGGLIIEAIAAGKQAAVHVERFLSGQPVVEDPRYLVRRVAVTLGARESRQPLPTAEWGERERMPSLAPDVRTGSFTEVENGFSDQQARREGKRCLRCHRPIVVALT
ncbi:MAG: FAD-dependent oxidoreductase [Gaiellales bacterium]|nr:FAD-dependent oxidoreductase [Gaiellales bacterium]